MPNDNNWITFLELCLKSKTVSRLDSLFHLLLTIEEREHLSSRVRIIQALLDQELSQRNISEKMDVSISQITRGSNALKIIPQDLLRFLEKTMKRGKTE